MLRVLTKYLERRVEIFTRFHAAQNGTTAVEFALIAPAFLAMIFAIFQTTIYFRSRSRPCKTPPCGPGACS
jgi:Flp pilus assembly protein TadG